jgi:hypothetical protein
VDNQEFQIVEVKYRDEIEQLGTKEKFWFKDNDGQKTLFKIGRPNTGENWSEVVTSSLCELLDIPHAKYEFAVWDGENGTITRSFVPKNHRLIHGNELLVKIHKDYPLEKKYSVREHTLRIVLKIMKLFPDLVPIGYTTTLTPLEIFCGYLMLDCWIGNPDRHHENWGFIVNADGQIYLAPTFDHASGLGCRVSDKERVERLHTKDYKFSVEYFVLKARSPFYHSPELTKPMPTIDVFRETLKHTTYWLDKLEKVNICDVEKIFNMIPKHLISEDAIKFSLKMLEINRINMLKLKEES